MINPNAARIKFIDGLRAIAVLLVMLFHFYYQQISDAGASLVKPVLLQQMFQYGNMGVYIFFVISGFIVSYVTYGKIDGIKYILSFIVRRQVRLDPPFWLTLILGTGLAIFSSEVLHNNVYVPTAGDVFFNFIYLFDIFDKYDIIRVGWTLCLEIQFYLIFIVLIFLLNSYCKPGRIRVFVYVCLYAVSFLSFGLLSSITEDYIINYWFVFFMGVGVTLLIHQELDERLYFIILSMPYALLLTDANMTPIYFSSATAIMIFVCFKLQKQDVWLSSRFFQFFGLISYSLYLIHCLIGNKIIRILKSILNWDPANIPMTIGILIISMTISTIFAYFFYLIIEKRSIKWSKVVSSLIK